MSEENPITVSISRTPESQNERAESIPSKPDTKSKSKVRRKKRSKSKRGSSGVNLLQAEGRADEDFLGNGKNIQNLSYDESKNLADKVINLIDNQKGNVIKLY